MNKFKVGDKVKIKEKYGNTYGISEETLEKLKKLKNIWTIESIRLGDKISFYTLKEERNGLCFFEDMLEKANYTYGDLKKAPIGTKITFENGEVLVKDDDGNYSNKKRWRDDSDLKELKDRINTLGKIIKIEEPTYQTVYEVKQEILDEAEKRYLKAVIRPFRARMKYIMKEDINYATKEYIRIDLGREMINLPKFDSGSMYKGMKLNKGYTLEELGL